MNIHDIMDIIDISNSIRNSIRNISKPKSELNKKDFAERLTDAVRNNKIAEDALKHSDISTIMIKPNIKPKNDMYTCYYCDRPSVVYKKGKYLCEVHKDHV